MKPTLLLLLLLMLAVGVPPASRAQTPADERAERDRIASQRAHAQAAYAERERACRERFVVASCLDDAQRDRRQALERLRQQEAVLDEGLRKQRAAQRLEDIGTKLGERDSRRREPTAREPRQDTLNGEAVGRSGTRAPAPASSAAAA